MGSREWTYWKVFREMYPWGDDWEQSAQEAWAAIAPHTSKPPRMMDLLPQGMRTEAILGSRQTPEQIRATLKGNK